MSKQVRESILHALRDCSRVQRIWKNLVHPSRWEEFMNTNHKEWLDWNLRMVKVGVHRDLCWQFIFQEMVYSVWKTRNEFNITGEESKLKISANQIVVQARQAQIAILKGIDINRKDWRFIH